jgi:YfiH family protein
MTTRPIQSDALLTDKHGFYTRDGGVSVGIYAGLNCGFGSDDENVAVAKNRDLVSSSLGLSERELATVYQVHSATVVHAIGPIGEPTPKADAVVTMTKGLGIGVLTADCAPLLFRDPTTNCVGAAHAGWQGALKGIGPATIDKMVEIGANRREIHAVVGPCISQKNYEVGAEFLERFLNDDPNHKQFFVNGSEGKYQFDLPAFCLHTLQGANIANASWTGHCTYADTVRFFSYRRSTHMKEPDYGRQISVITP